MSLNAPDPLQNPWSEGYLSLSNTSSLGFNSLNRATDFSNPIPTTHNQASQDRLSMPPPPLNSSGQVVSGSDALSTDNRGDTTSSDVPRAEKRHKTKGRPRVKTDSNEGGSSKPTKLRWVKGLKEKPIPEDATDEERQKLIEYNRQVGDARKEHVREQNRKSAAKSRRRKESNLKVAVTHATGLRDENRHLREENQHLREAGPGDARDRYWRMEILRRNHVIYSLNRRIVALQRDNNALNNLNPHTNLSNPSQGQTPNAPAPTTTSAQLSNPMPLNSFMQVDTPALSQDLMQLQPQNISQDQSTSQNQMEFNFAQFDADVMQGVAWDPSASFSGNLSGGLSDPLLLDPSGNPSGDFSASLPDHVPGDASESFLGDLGDLDVPAFSSPQEQQPGSDEHEERVEDTIYVLGDEADLNKYMDPNDLTKNPSNDGQ